MLHLIELGLLEEREVLDNAIEVQDLSRRNRNLAVRVDGGAGWFVKQGTKPQSLATIAHEANVYAYLRRFGDGSICASLPDRSVFDRNSNTLILSLTVNHEPIDFYHQRIGRRPKVVGRSLGRALASLHRTPATEDSIWSESRKPWVLSIHKPRLSSLTEFSSANLGVIRIIQQNPLFESTFTRLAADWDATAIIHNDIKWDNILAISDARRHFRTVGLIDWEFANLGEPSWDVGCVFAAYLTTWVRSIPVVGTQPTDGFAALATCPLNSAFAAQSEFWYEYLACSGIHSMQARQLLTRAMLMAAAKLVASTIEVSQPAALVTGDVLILLQLALNIMRRPIEASRYLCGIE